MLLFLLIIAAFDFVNWLVDGGWSSWDRWSQCTVTCRGGTRKRSRSCTNPPAAHGGKSCSGQHLEIEKCKDVFCSGNNEIASTENNFSSHFFYAVYNGLEEICLWNMTWCSMFNKQEGLEMIDLSGPKVGLTNCLFRCPLCSLAI